MGALIERYFLISFNSIFDASIEFPPLEDFFNNILDFPFLEPATLALIAKITIINLILLLIRDLILIHNHMYQITICSYLQF